MEDVTLRPLIVAKIHDGRLPKSTLPHVWGGPSHGALCNACEEKIPKQQLEIEGVVAGGTAFLFHVHCFQLWDTEQKADQQQVAR